MVHVFKDHVYSTFILVTICNPAINISEINYPQTKQLFRSTFLDIKAIKCPSAHAEAKTQNENYNQLIAAHAKWRTCLASPAHPFQDLQNNAKKFRFFFQKKKTNLML